MELGHVDFSECLPLDPSTFNPKHSKTLHQNLCIPSTAQSYSICIEYMKRWFLSLFERNPFKTVYVDGKNIFDDYRRLSAVELLKRQKPALAIIPNIDWGFNDENRDIYQYGTTLYQTRGLYSNSFYQDREHNSYLGIMMETLFMEFTFRIRVETRAQQLDMFKYLQLASKVNAGSFGEDVDLDFHVPYDIMLAIAADAGFEIVPSKEDDETAYPYVKNIQEFLAFLNSHSEIPFLYKLRTINGKNEFFIRMQDMYVHVKPTGLSGDDGEREAVMSNNFHLEMTAEVRFPAPKFFAYYTDNSRDFRTVYSAWRQPSGIVSVAYTFKGIEVPNQNALGWHKYLETNYESDPEDINKPLVADLSPLLNQGDLGETIKACVESGVSPSIFFDVFATNGGEILQGSINWSNMTYETTQPIRNINTFFAFYMDMMYINDYIIVNRDAKKNRLQHTKDPKSQIRTMPQRLPDEKKEVPPPPGLSLNDHYVE